MKLYHATTWPKLRSALAADALVPGPFSKDDLTNAPITELNKLGVHATFLTTNFYGLSKFGACVLGWEAEQLLGSELLHLGPHNCDAAYLASPDGMSSLLAAASGAPVVQTSNVLLAPKTPSSRWHFLVPWPIMPAREITFTISSVEDHVLAQAGLLAWSLRGKGPRITPSDMGSNPQRLARLLIENLTGLYPHVFEDARATANGSSGDPLEIDTALDHMIAGRRQDTAKCCARFGDMAAIVVEVCDRFTTVWNVDVDPTAIRRELA